MVDYFGVHTMLIIFSCLVTIGQLIFFLGVSFESFYLALAGRGIFGCGGEVLELAQTIIVIKWFTGKELSMTFGLTSMFALLGSVANDNIEPTIAEHYGLNTALFISFIVCAFSLLVTLIVIRIDKTLVLSNYASESSRFSLRYLRSLDLVFFLLMANTICMGCSIYCFSYVASGFLQDRFGFSAVVAGSIMSISFFVSAFLSPFVGIFADKYGRRTEMMILANGLVLMFQCFWMWCGDGIGIGLIIAAFVELGFAFAIYVTVFWSCISFVVKKDIVGTAYGLAYSVENLALSIIPVGIGLVQENTHKDKGYFWVNAVLAMLSVFGFIAATLVYQIDKSSKGELNVTSKDLISRDE